MKTQYYRKVAGISNYNVEFQNKLCHLTSVKLGNSGLWESIMSFQL